MSRIEQPPAEVRLTLTEQQEKRRTNLVNRWVELGVARGETAKELLDEELYKSTHESFDVFCKEVLGYDGSYVRRLIKAFETFNNVSPIGETRMNALPSEAALRPLTKL